MPPGIPDMQSMQNSGIAPNGLPMHMAMPPMPNGPVVPPPRQSGEMQMNGGPGGGDQRSPSNPGTEVII
jgi:hypothetical protein